MANLNTKIEWCDATWSPVTGCTKVSAGCKNCYAERFARRQRQDFSKVILHPERLDWPLHRRKPLKIFVNSMSDLFHPQVPAKFIVKVFEVMAECPQHTFQVLTKRPERIGRVLFGEEGRFYLGGHDYLPTVILGTSVEDQPTADDRIPNLFNSGWMGNFFVSYEPTLGPVDLSCWLPQVDWNPTETEFSIKPALAWVIAGGESGPGARPAHPDWFRSVRDQCRWAGVPFFFKQVGEWADHFTASPWLIPGHKIRRLFIHRSGQVLAQCPEGWPDDESWGAMYQIGKKRAGRLLDGREWNEFPQNKGAR